MDGIRAYLIGVIASAILCGLVTTFLDTKGVVGTSVKLLAGLLMLLAVMRPWVSVSLDHLLDWTENIGTNGSGFVAEGEMMAENTYRQSIISRTEAYILDEAKALECDITVEVVLSDDDIPTPKLVKMTGQVSPYARQTLSNFLTERLGIKREDQIWT